MKHFGLLGEHLSHSYSKIIHQYIFKEIGLDADYRLIECQEQELKDWIDQLRQGKFSGFNVTIPYKKKIMDHLDIIDEKALKIGSVNTVYLLNGKVHGTNTDYDGFLETIKKYQIDVWQKDCYILGTGGASLAIVQVLKDLGGICYTVSRTPDETQISYQDLQKKSIDILVNTTPVGMYPNVLASPVSLEVSKKAKVVMDIIFNPHQTKLLKDAESNMNGLYMLLIQAIRAEEIWQGINLMIYADEILKKLKFLLELPKEIFDIVKDLNFNKDQIGCSEDSVYLFENQYILKISSDLKLLKREKERVDWLSDKILGSKSVAYVETDRAYYLRTMIHGDSLSAKRFLDNPLLLIKTIKKVIEVLRGLDQYHCPYYSTDSLGNYFVHGDLCLPNIFVDQQNNFCGFIDLDNAGVGDVWYDYAWLLWSFEYNLKTNHYNNLLLENLGLIMDEQSYLKYIPAENIARLKEDKEE